MTSELDSLAATTSLPASGSLCLSTVRTMALVTVVRSMDTNKIIRQTNVLLKIFLCFDIFFIVSFIVQLVWLSSIILGGFTEGEATWNLHFLTTRKFVEGYCFIGFFSASLICNSLAIVGVRRWNQWYVLPWLFVFTAFKIFLIACFIYEILYKPFNFGQIFLLFLMMSVMSALRHMQKLFFILGMERPTGSDVEENVHSREKIDLPPKYEDVTDSPPKYEEATMRTEAQ